MMRILLPISLLVSCGVAENDNSLISEIRTPKESTKPNASEDTLGFNRGSQFLNSSNSKEHRGLSQYVRFTRGEHKCSGVLSWEWEAPNDVYLYTARHCFEKSDPVRGVQWDFDLASNSKPLIDSALIFDTGVGRPVNLRSDNIEALSLNSQFVPSGFGKNRASGAEPTDVVRIYQYSKAKSNAQVFDGDGKLVLEKICDSGGLVRSGYRGTFGYPDPSRRGASSNGVVKTVSRVAFDSLRTKLSEWLPGSKLQISSHLFKLANSTTLPGESGSPVFVATKRWTAGDYSVNKTYFVFNCIDGIMTREITRLGQMGESYYNVMSFSGTSRSWSKVWRQKGFAKTAPSGSTAPLAVQPAKASPMQTQNAGPEHVQRLPGAGEVALSLIDLDGNGQPIKSAIVSDKSGIRSECDKLVKSSYAAKSSNSFECFANGTRVQFYDAPGYDNKFNSGSGAQGSWNSTYLPDDMEAEWLAN